MIVAVFSFLIPYLLNYFSLFWYIFLTSSCDLFAKNWKFNLFWTLQLYLKFIDTEQFQRQVSLSRTSSSVVAVVDLSLLHADCKYTYFVQVFEFILAAICLWPDGHLLFSLFHLPAQNFRLCAFTRNIESFFPFVFQASWS